MYGKVWGRDSKNEDTELSFGEKMSMAFGVRPIVISSGVPVRAYMK